MPESLRRLQEVLAEAQAMGQPAPWGAGRQEFTRLPGSLWTLESAIYNAKENWGWGGGRQFILTSTK